MKHSSVVVLDTALRNVWFNQGQFGLSAALHASAKMKQVYQQK